MLCVIKVFTLLVLSEPCHFSQHPYHFHPCSDYLAEGPSTGKKFWFGTDEMWYGQVVYSANFIRAEPFFFLEPVPIDLFSLYVLFSHFRPRDVLKGIFLLFFHKLCVHSHVHRTTFERKFSLE